MFRIDTENAIISCLATHKDYTMQELYACVTSKNISVSLPNFYKIISRMIDSQILVKTKGKLQLHAMYMHYVVSLANDVQETYFSDKNYQIKNLLPGEHKIFSASSIYDVDVIWMDLLGQLVKEHPGEEGFYYNSHPYHILSIPHKEKANMEDI